jgi:hypothetical protein
MEKYCLRPLCVVTVEINTFLARFVAMGTLVRRGSHKFEIFKTLLRFLTGMQLANFSHIDA